VVRIKALDGLRAVAVVAVLVSHTVPAAAGGFLGVDIFFVLSGFLITSLLLAERAGTGRVDLVAFYRRRAARLMPAYLAMLLLAVPIMIGPLAGTMSWPVPRAVLATTFYGANWAAMINVDALGPIVHTWSLSIEEQFYLGWPLTFLLLVRPWERRWERLTRWLTVAFVVVVSLRALGRSVTGGIWPYFATVTHSDGLLIGCLLAVLLARLPSSTTPRRWPGQAAWLALAVLAGLAAVLRIEGTATYAGGLALAVLATAVVVGQVVVDPTSRLTRLMSLPPLVGIGRISYGLYLYHLPIFALVQSFRLPGVVNVLLEWGGTALVALASWVWLEQPVQRVVARRWPLHVAAEPASGQVPDTVALQVPIQLLALIPTPTSGVRLEREPVAEDPGMDLRTPPAGTALRG